MAGAGGAVCPVCCKHITWKQLTVGSEKYAFRCSKCDARLTKWTSAFPILIVGGLAVVGGIYFFVDTALLGRSLLAWTCVLAVVGYFTTTVRVAGNDIPDEPNEEIRSGPPPLDPRFRGSSSPPPKHED